MKQNRLTTKARGLLAAGFSLLRGDVAMMVQMKRRRGTDHHSSSGMLFVGEEVNMVICIRIGGVTHCYDIPIVLWPLGPHKPGPGPVNYPQLFRDATIVASLKSAADQVSDAGVKAALEGGIKAAVGALQKRGGEHVSVSAE
jgi:hypothetical protein